MSGPDIFLSYSHHDFDRAYLIVKSMEKKGLRVWWDQLLMQQEPDQRADFRKEIPKVLHDALSVIVLWSQQSLESLYVHKEAVEAANDKSLLLVHIKLDIDIELEFPFHDLPEASLLDFSKWKGKPSDKCFDLLLKQLIQIVPVLKETMAAESKFNTKLRNLSGNEVQELKVPGTEFFSSFIPSQKGGCARLQLPSTEAWIPEELYNALPTMETSTNLVPLQLTELNGKQYVNIPSKIFVIHDPIRPFETQISITRSLRPGGKIGSIEGHLDQGFLEGWYLQIWHEKFQWLRMSMAEILTDAELLDYIAAHDPDQQIQELASKNPFAKQKRQEKSCLFCNTAFRNRDGSEMHKGAFIFPNDYPFGPYFHYVVAVRDPVHAWDQMDFKHYLAMNQLIHNFLTRRNRANINGAKGIAIGLNSTTRHLVLGKQTRSSAGASIAHVHKQVWGMAPSSINLAEKLITVCDTYWQDSNIDYLAEYLNTLREMKCVLWENEYVALFVPFCQVSLHELQVIVKRPVGNFLDLEEPEIKSLSQAEWIATLLFSAWNINSFNEVILGKTFDDTRGKTFRLLMIFITREIDLAVSELNLLYVVDRHPLDTIRQFIALQYEESEPSQQVKAALNFDCLQV